MKQDEAVQHLRAFMITLQRFRGIVMEELGPGTGELHLTKEVAATAWPWIFGEKCPLPALSRILADVDEGGPLVPMDYYNMMTILDRFTPEVKAAANIWLGQSGWAIIPDSVSLEVLRGWE